ncbi:MAG: hypothetical protein LHV68_00270 [Elusimicrobia bacterium]|nr:hypothetical protein [Candidatus Liberimonas magnetica]
MNKSLIFINKKHKDFALHVVLAGLVIFSLLLNSIAMNIDPRETELLGQVVKSQSVLLNVFFLSTIPIKIVNNLFNEYRNPDPAVAKKAAKEKSKNAKNTSADFSIFASGINSETIRSNSNRVFTAVYKDSDSILNIICPANVFTRGSPGGGGTSVFVLLMLMLFSLLPRGTIDASAVIYLHRIFSAQLEV